jgi:hypothetical protein
VQQNPWKMSIKKPQAHKQTISRSRQRFFIVREKLERKTRSRSIICKHFAREVFASPGITVTNQKANPHILNFYSAP